MPTAVVFDPIIIAAHKLPDIFPDHIRMSHPGYIQLHLLIISLGAGTPVIQPLLNIVGIIVRWEPL